jgi:type IV secretory pathway component VirB8
MGIIILTSKLRPTEDWELGKTEDEKTRLLAEMRIVEVKWAKRCIYALLTLFTIILVIVLAVVFGKR